MTSSRWARLVRVVVQYTGPPSELALRIDEADKMIMALLKDCVQYVQDDQGWVPYTVKLQSMGRRFWLLGPRRWGVWFPEERRGDVVAILRENLFIPCS